MGSPRQSPPNNLYSYGKIKLYKGRLQELVGESVRRRWGREIDVMLLRRVPFIKTVPVGGVVIGQEMAAGVVEGTVADGLPGLFRAQAPQALADSGR